GRRARGRGEHRAGRARPARGGFHHLDGRWRAGESEPLERRASKSGETENARADQRDRQRRDDQEAVASASTPLRSDTFEPLEPKSLRVVVDRAGLDRSPDRCCRHCLLYARRRSRRAAIYPELAEASIVSKFNRSWAWRARPARSSSDHGAPFAGTLSSRRGGIRPWPTTNPSSTAMATSSSPPICGRNPSSQSIATARSASASVMMASSTC